MKETMQTHTKTTTKAVRLVYLWLMSQMDRPVSYVEHAELFDIDKANAHREINFDLPAIQEGVEKLFPQLSNLFRKHWLDYVPMIRSNKADRSTMTVTLTVDHKTGEVTWEPFVQHLYEGDTEIASIEIDGKGGE